MRCSETKIQKFIAVKSSYVAVQQCYTVVYPRGAILEPWACHNEGIPRLGVGLRCGVGSLCCGVGTR